ncbi:uncharacterized protein [Macrobrachium rosenbergii]|uniref:uncharacterized protein n=1 Tax=Macrobrachium rosenbergii TaxID=79674 RepID=UPI0034D75BC5
MVTGMKIIKPHCATADTETSGQNKHMVTEELSRHKISDDCLNPCEEVCREKIQLVDEMKAAWDAHNSEGHSTDSHVEEKQSYDSDGMHTKSLASDSSVTLEIREKGSFLEDLHFVSMREALTSALHEILSKYIAVPSNDDLLSSYRQLQEQNAMKHSEPLSMTQEDDTHYKIVIDVSTLRRTGIAVFLRNRNEIHVVGQPLQHESDCQVSELFKCFVLPEEISSVDTSTSLSSDGFLMITVVKKGNLNELTTEEDNGMAGFLTAARDDSFETRRHNLTTESSASSQSTVVQEEHLTEPHSSSHSKEKDTLIEESFSSTSDQVSTNLKNSCTSISLVGLNKEQPFSTAEHEPETPKSPSVLGNAISSECNETDAFVSATDATSVQIQEEQKPKDISLLEETYMGKENSSECHEHSTYKEQTEEYEQHTTGTSKAVEAEKDADTSVNSLSFVDQNLDANDSESALSVIEEISEETSSIDNCIVLNVQEKGLFDEDIFFQNIRHKLQTKEKKFLSRERDLSSINEDLSDEENLSLLNDKDESQTVTSIDDGDQFMIIMDVSKYLHVKEMQLDVMDNNAVLIKGSAVTEGAEYDDVKTFSKRLGLPGGIDVESAHCVISEDGVLVVAFSKVTSAATDDECPGYGGRMQSTSVDTISNIDSDTKDFMQSMTYGHRTSCGVDTSAQAERSVEHNLSAEVNCLSGDIHDSLTTSHSNQQ